MSDRTSIEKLIYKLCTCILAFAVAFSGMPAQALAEMADTDETISQEADDDASLQVTEVGDADAQDTLDSIEEVEGVEVSANEEDDQEAVVSLDEGADETAGNTDVDSTETSSDDRSGTASQGADQAGTADQEAGHTDAANPRTDQSGAANQGADQSDAAGQEADQAAAAAQLAADLEQATDEVARSLREQADETPTTDQLVELVYLRLAQADLADEPTDTATLEAQTADPTYVDSCALAALKGEPTTYAGITRAARLLLHELGIESLEVQAADTAAVAEGLPARTWLMVQLDDAWYHVDAAAAAKEHKTALQQGDVDADISMAWLLVSDDTLAASDETRAPWTVLDESEDIELPVASADFPREEASAEDTQDQAASSEDEATGQDDATTDEGTEQDGATTETTTDDAADAEENIELAIPSRHSITLDKNDYIYDSYTLTLDNTWSSSIYLVTPDWSSYNQTGNISDLNPDVWTITIKETGKATLSVTTPDTSLQWGLYQPSTNTMHTNWTVVDGSRSAATNTQTVSLNAGTYKAYIISNGSSGHYQIKGSFVASKRNIAKAKFASVSAKGYTGKAITPKPTVKWGSTKLVLGRDYTISYKNNVKIGTASLIIKGKGNYTGSKTIKFAIKRNIAKAKTSKAKNYTYTGKKRYFVPTVKWGSTTLKRNTDYTLSWKNNVKAGTATVIIKGKGRYAGTKKIRYKILKRSLAKAKVATVKNQLYTGNARKPTPTVKLGKKTLKRGTDYTISYKNNRMPGTATLVIKGKGNYKGSKAIKFKIVRKQYYKMKRDTWRFYNDDYAIPFSLYNRVYRNKSQARLVQRRNATAGGCCYGFCTTVGAIARYKTPAANTFLSNGTRAGSIYQVGQSWKSTSNNLSALSLIKCGQITQYDYRMQREYSNHYNNLSALANAARSSVKGGTPIVISVSGTDYSTGGYIGHAIFPLAITTNNSSKMVISIYDCNFPSSAQKLVLYKSGGRYTSWSYLADYSYVSWNGAISYTTPCDNFNALYKGGGTCAGSALGSDGATLVSVSSDAQLVAADGSTYTLSEAAENDPNKVLHVCDLGGSSASGEELYWVTLDSNRMGFTGIAEDTSVSVATETSGVDVSVTAGSEVVVDMDDNTNSKVVIDTQDGSDFAVSFVDETTGDALDELTITGTAEGIIVAQQDDDALTVSGMSSITVTDTNGNTGEAELDPTKVYEVSFEDNGSETGGAGGPARVAAGAKVLLVEVLGDAQATLPQSDENDK